MLRIEEVSKNYGEIRALNSISLSIRKGETLGLVGPNGSGKSTLLKIIAGILRPSSGRIIVDDKELSEKDWIAYKRRIGYMPERISFYDNLTGKETLRLFARLKGLKSLDLKDIPSGIISEEILNRRVGGYSKGMKQRLNLCQAILGDPDILILDEPTSGLDPVGTKEFYDIIASIKKKRVVTIILSSHILAEIEDKVDRVAILKDGFLKAVGSLADLSTGLALPLRISILPAPSLNGALEELLRREGALEVTRRDNYIIATIAREDKMKVLSSIMQKRDYFLDLSVIEPSLEEVFFGIH
jgi:Cu-processing system ATP-binding protein